MVAFTGHQRWEHTPADGFDAYLLKPAALDQLDEVLAAVSQRPPLRAAADEARPTDHRGVGPRLIILDLMMPVMNGWDFRRAQLADPKLAALPVIVVSAHHEANQLAGSPGVRDVLLKPMDLDQLLHLVEAACPG